VAGRQRFATRRCHVELSYYTYGKAALPLRTILLPAQ